MSPKGSHLIPAQYDFVAHIQVIQLEIAIPG